GHSVGLGAQIVKQVVHTEEQNEDLISIRTMWLMKGEERFKTGKGTELVTYNARCIENEILMYLRTLKKTRKDVSLYSPIAQDHEGNEITLLDVVEAESENILEYIQLNMNISQMKTHFKELTDREINVLNYRFGLDS